jgi:hypothetical protein
MADQTPGPGDALDGERIRLHAAARRTAYRSRSHAIAAAITCQVLAVQLAWWGLSTWWLLWCTLAIVAQALAILFARSALALHRQAARSALVPPASTPDFSGLRDGSQRWEDLDNVQ